LASAIYNTEVKKTGYKEAFDVLCQYNSDKKFRNAVVKIKNILDNDETIKLLGNSTGLSKEDIKQVFEDIGNYM